MKDRDNIYLEKRKTISVFEKWSILVYTDREKRGKKGRRENKFGEGENNFVFQILPASPLYLRRASHSRNRKHLRPEVSRTIET